VSKRTAAIVGIVGGAMGVVLLGAATAEEGIPWYVVAGIFSAAMFAGSRMAEQ